MMHPDRVRLQLAAAQACPGAIVGSNVVRLPPDSQHRFTDWANSLTQVCNNTRTGMSRLVPQCQAYTSHRRTVICGFVAVLHRGVLCG